LPAASGDEFGLAGARGKGGAALFGLGIGADRRRARLIGVAARDIAGRGKPVEARSAGAFRDVFLIMAAMFVIALVLVPFAKTAILSDTPVSEH
jgi:hypothetical protein